MRSIKSVAFIGLGALGVNFAQHFIQYTSDLDVRIVASKSRIERYKKEGVFYNGKACNFHFVNDDMICEPVDLAIFCTKFHGLEDAMQSMRNQIDEHTLLMSAINGISSEEVLSSMYKKENIIYTVAQGMDATKVDNQVSCTNMGELCFGDVMEGEQHEAVNRIAAFFLKYKFPHTVKDNILHHQWGKFMLNVGLNQVVAKYRGTYETVQVDGDARNEMIQAMNEVYKISQFTEICLKQEELQEWIAMVDRLSPEGKPSMAQDVDAGRKTEVELFAGTVLKLASQFHTDVPMNHQLYQEIKKIEATYEKTFL